LARKLVAAKPRKGLDIDAIALRIIKKFQPKVLIKPTPFNTEEFFEFDLERVSGVKTDYRVLPTGIYGVTDSDKKISIISSDLMDDSSQIKFTRSTMAHETGHVLIHVPEFRMKKALLKSIHDDKHASLRMYREDDIPVFRNPEWQAWRFAGALLMPAMTFKAAIQQGYDEYDLSDAFQVNRAFVKTRMRALKIAF
jgi:Zn-dependent peptidase ImmA (M78 family)